MNRIISYVILGILISTVMGQHPSHRPALAYSKGDTVVLASINDETIKTIKTPIDIGEFSISPDLKNLILIPSHPGKYGAKMYLYKVESKELIQIPKNSINAAPGKSGIYSDPQFSPDGSRVLFVAHSQAEGDLVEGSGPLAVLDMKSLHATVLQSTSNIDGLGPDFANNPKWSPDGKNILINFEGSMAITEQDGKSLRDLSDLPPHISYTKSPFTWNKGINWIGNNCVFYQAGNDQNMINQSGMSFFVFNIKNGENYESAKVLGLTNKELDGLYSYVYPNAIVMQTKPADRGYEWRIVGYILVTRDGVRSKLKFDGYSTVQLLQRNVVSELPSECK
ncbi:MAG TPA: hypothetical protein VGE85_06995 [Terracidiphilus sp.]